MQLNFVWICVRGKFFIWILCTLYIIGRVKIFFTCIYFYRPFFYSLGLRLQKLMNFCGMRKTKNMAGILLRLLSSIVFSFGPTIEQEVALVNACQSPSPIRNFLATIKNRLYMKFRGSPLGHGFNRPLHRRAI